MPILCCEQHEFILIPPRKVPVVAQADVLVVGGGPAGIGAALGAAKAGVKVVLVERYGFLGGNATAALVMPLMSFHTQYSYAKNEDQKPYRLWPYDHGPGEPVIAGVLNEFLNELIANSGAINPSQETGYVVPFDPEIFKWTALKILERAGVFMLFHALACDVIKKDSTLKGVLFETKSGPIIINAKMTVDCTGDGDIAYQSGEEYDLGRVEDGLTQPMTLMFRMGNFNPFLFQDYVRQHPNQWKGVHGLWDLIKKASEEGQLQLPREDFLCFSTVHQDELSVNSTRVTNVSGVSVWDLSRAEYISRQQMQQIVNFLNKYVPGFADSYVIQSGVQVGVRETRRVRGLYTLTEEDILSAKKFNDVIARSTYPIDVHNPLGKGTILKHLPLGESYDIPLRCLIPKKLKGLLVAGRCISGTHEAHSSYRVMPVCMATGHAAGVCAALTIKENIPAQEISATIVQKELIQQGANLGQKGRFAFTGSNKKNNGRKEYETI